MGKGGPLAFLNKKTWHPGRIQNMEEVWKREQAAEQEKQKLKDLQKQIQEERAREEMHSLAEAAGVKIRSDRLDWMYQGGVAARQEADQRQQAAAAPPRQDGGAAPGSGQPPGGRATTAASLPSFYSEDTPATANEMWQRLHSDPLFAIKQQEIAARRNIVANPVQMQAIKAQVRQIQGGDDGDRKRKKKDVKEKKEKKHKRDRSRERKRHRGSESPEPRGRHRSAERDAPRAAQERHHRGSDRSPAKVRVWEEEDRNRDRDEDRHRHRGDRGDRGANREEPSRRRERSRSRSASRERRRRHRDRSRDGAREGGGRRSRSPEAARYQRYEEWRERSPPLGHTRGDIPRDGHGERSGREGAPGTNGGVAVHVDGASAQGAGAKYGISFGANVPEELQRRDRSDLAEATRRRLEDAARKKEAEEGEKAAQRYQRRDYRPGRMTEGERKKKLEEMAVAADDHDAQRRSRLKEHEDKVAAEEAAQRARHHSDTAGFLKAATKEVYGASAGGGAADPASLADAVGRRKALSQRGDGGGAFRRQPPTSHVELTPQASQAAGAYRPVPASRPQTLTQYGGDLSQAAPGGGGTQWDTSTERRIRHDQQALHATQIQPGDSVASFGDGYVPAPPVSHHSGGWSYSEGDDVHIPETRLPRDAGHSAVTSPEFTMPAYVNGSPMYRPGVQARYPVWGTQPSAATSVAQPSYPQHQGHTAVGVAPVNGGVGYQVASPGPEGVEQQQGGGQLYGTPSRVNALLHAAGVPPGSSAAHVKLTPEQRQQVERKRKQALEKRQAMHEKRARVARELFVGGQSGGPLGVAPNSPGGAGAGGGSNWQTPAALQHHSAPEATHSTSPAGRAEANRLLALQRRACRLEQQVADLLQKEATVGKAACLQLRRQLEDDVRKYVIAARQLPQGAVPSPGSSQGSGDVASQGSDLTPAQRERAEANRQAALLRQQQRVEQSVGAFIARAEGKARLAEAGGSGEGGAPDQMGHAFI